MCKYKRAFLSLLLIILVLNTSVAQDKFSDFLKPSDSLNKPRIQALVVGKGAFVAGTLIGLNQLWYKNYPKSDFHFIIDNADWLQMDKAGHVFAAYHLGRASSESLKWAGISRNSQLIYGASLGFILLSTIEVFDGYSAQWGASWGDIIANSSGTFFFVGQELLWKEQRITPKFSFHTTPFAALRPNTLGSTFSEQVLKDYNGQTYWLSANVSSFIKTATIPKWLNVALGYGGDGMLTGTANDMNAILLPVQTRTRQFYVSLDVDLTRINTKSHFLKTLFSVLNTIKIPAPTIEINSSGRLKAHAFYF